VAGTEKAVLIRLNRQTRAGAPRGAQPNSGRAAAAAVIWVHTFEVDLRRIDAAHQIGAVADGRVEQVENARAAAREHYRDRVTVQIVAFPQSGVMRQAGRPGCAI
jgi:hypothetical protein